uniref:Uncharacterized protein n=1 Tax=Trichogramma kaykai TaxID=54128 RepID=A0ABD2WE29_9HYME
MLCRFAATHFIEGTLPSSRAPTRRQNHRLSATAAQSSRHPTTRRLPLRRASIGRASASATRPNRTHARASAPATRCVITRSCIGACHPTRRDSRPRIGTCHAVRHRLYHVRLLRHRSHEERPSCATFAAHAFFTELFVSGADAPTLPASPSEPFLRARLPPSTGQWRNEHREPCRPARRLPIVLQASSFASARIDGATHRVVSSSSQLYA